MQSIRIRVMILLAGLVVSASIVNAHIRRQSTTASDTSRAETTSANGAGELHFKDIARSAGVTYFWTVPDWVDKGFDIIEVVGHGCALLDYDGDGNLDLLLVGRHPALYRGDGHGHFTDVTHRVGLDKVEGEFFGCAVGDYANEGYPDIYLTGYRTGVLLHNERGRRFRDVTKQMGLKPQPFGTSASFADIDGDGRLDLVIGNYVKFQRDPNAPKKQNDVFDAAPLHPTIWHNEGNHSVDVTATWGAVTSGKCLGIAVADFDRTGRQSIALANDQMPGDLLTYRDGKLVNVAKRDGVAYGENCVHSSGCAGMGIDWADTANDGRLDLMVTTHRDETKNLFRNTGQGTFENVSTRREIQPAARYVAWGIKFCDFDNDGWLDIAIANGETDGPGQRGIKSAQEVTEPVQIFRNQDGKRFAEVSDQSGDDFAHRILGRALAIGDIDNDGRMDVVVTDADGHPMMLHNDTAGAGHWLLVNLIGTKSNRDGIGAELTLDAAGRKLLRYCHTDGSYLSASDKRVHFGLGSGTSGTLTIRWPSGIVQTVPDISADHVITVRETAR